MRERVNDVINAFFPSEGIGFHATNLQRAQSIESQGFKTVHSTTGEVHFIVVPEYDVSIISKGALLLNIETTLNFHARKVSSPPFNDRLDTEEECFYTGCCHF